MKFYIDSASPEDVEYALNKMKAACGPSFISNFAGITTNPNAFAKINVNTYRGMINGLHALKLALDPWREPYMVFTPNSGWQVRPDTFEYHVQLPVSTLSPQAFLPFVDTLLADLPIYYYPINMKIVIKIPPRLDLINAYQDKMNNVDSQAYPRLNVTGLSSAYDCQILLGTANYIKYVSLIPGRMTEAGLNTLDHLDICERFAEWTPYAEQYVITGAMRTPLGVLEAAGFTCPTIGRTVWSAMNTEDCQQLIALLNAPPRRDHKSERLVPVEVGTGHIKLTNDFFAQMDRLGQPIWNSFKQEQLDKLQEKLS